MSTSIKNRGNRKVAKTGNKNKTTTLDDICGVVECAFKSVEDTLADAREILASALGEVAGWVKPAPAAVPPTRRPARRKKKKIKTV